MQAKERLRTFYTFLSKQRCRELLEFWAVVELYQNLYWKPFQLLGLKLHVKNKKPGERETDVEGNKYVITKETVVTTEVFTIEHEKTLREEIIDYYITDKAQYQICLPSQTKSCIIKTSKQIQLQTSSSMINNPSFRLYRLSLFREAQRFCYEELQRIYLPQFIEHEKMCGGGSSRSSGSGSTKGNILPPYSPGLAAITSSVLASDVLELRREDVRLRELRGERPSVFSSTGSYGW